MRRAQRALRRTPDLDIVVDGIFGPVLKSAIEQFQGSSGLTADGVVGPLTWAALPDGAPMPTLQQGEHGDVVRSLQTVLANGADAWGTGPGAADGDSGPNTAASVKAFQSWGQVTADGIVGDQTWSVSLHALSATLESQVGLNHVIN